MKILHESTNSNKKMSCVYDLDFRFIFFLLKNSIRDTGSVPITIISECLGVPVDKDDPAKSEEMFKEWFTDNTEIMLTDDARAKIQPLIDKEIISKVELQDAIDEINNDYREDFADAVTDYMINKSLAGAYNEIGGSIAINDVRDVAVIQCNKEWLKKYYDAWNTNNDDFYNGGMKQLMVDAVGEFIVLPHVNDIFHNEIGLTAPLYSKKVLDYFNI